MCGSLMRLAARVWPVDARPAAVAVGRVGGATARTEGGAGLVLLDARGGYMKFTAQEDRAAGDCGHLGRAAWRLACRGDRVGSKRTGWAARHDANDVVWKGITTWDRVVLDQFKDATPPQLTLEGNVSCKMETLEGYPQLRTNVLWDAGTLPTDTDDDRTFLRYPRAHRLASAGAGGAPVGAPPEDGLPGEAVAGRRVPSIWPGRRVRRSATRADARSDP